MRLLKYTSIQCRLHVLLSMYMDTGMYHEPRHELDYTGNTVIVELNSI